MSAVKCYKLPDPASPDPSAASLYVGDFFFFLERLIFGPKSVCYSTVMASALRLSALLRLSPLLLLLLLLLAGARHAAATAKMDRVEVRRRLPALCPLPPRRGLKDAGWTARRLAAVLPV